MKKNVVRIILIVGFCVGLIISLYPLISNIYSRKNQMDVINKYQEDIEKIDGQEMANELELANAYNRKLNQTIVLTDPFDPSAIDMADDAYYDILNYTDDGVMAYINIPKIDVNLPIYHGTDSEHMLKGVGHLVGTSFPVGGVDTHAVLSAHSGLSTAELFTNLADLKKGDLFYIHVLDDVLAYEVDKINVVKPDETNDLKIAFFDASWQHSITMSAFDFKRYGLNIGFDIPTAYKAFCIRLINVGCVVRVLQELLLPLSRGMFIDIVPFSGTIN